MSYRSFLDLDTINTMILLLITGLYYTSKSFDLADLSFISVNKDVITIISDAESTDLMANARECDDYFYLRVLNTTQI